MIKIFQRLKERHQLGFAIIILSGIVCIWRAVYGLLELYLYPGNKLLSYVVSFIAGVAILAATHYTIEKIV